MIEAINIGKFSDFLTLTEALKEISKKGKVSQITFQMENFTATYNPQIHVLTSHSTKDEIFKCVQIFKDQGIPLEFAKKCLDKQSIQQKKFKIEHLNDITYLEQYISIERGIRKLNL